MHNPFVHSLGSPHPRSSAPTGLSGWTLSGAAILLGAGTMFEGAALAEQVRLANGDILTVQIVEATSEHVTFIHPVFGTMTVAAAQIEVLPASAAPATSPPAPPPPAAGAPAAAPPADAATPQPAAAPVADAAPAAASPPPAVPPPPPAPPKNWVFKFTLAGGSVSGNSESASLATKLAATKETENYKVLLEAAYFYASSNGDTSDNKGYLLGTYNWLFPGKRYFFFTDARLDYDEFNSWDERFTAHVGAGYRFILPPKLALNGTIGIGVLREWGGLNDNWRPEGLIGLDGKYDISEKQSIVFATTYYPQLDSFDPYYYRWVNSLGWQWKINGDDGLALTAGVAHEYQEQILPDRKHNDVRIFAGVDWTF
jgi:hypothetical protein